jgi:hypothetical protein
VQRELTSFGEGVLEQRPIGLQLTAGLFNIVRASPDTPRYENQLILAEGDYVIAHGRFSGIGHEAARVAAKTSSRSDFASFKGSLALGWNSVSPQRENAFVSLPEFNVLGAWGNFAPLRGMEHFQSEMYCGTQILFDDFNREQYVVVLIEHIGPVFGH